MPTTPRTRCSSSCRVGSASSSPTTWRSSSPRDSSTSCPVVMHNPIAEEEVEIVLVETVTTAHTGDVVVDGSVPIEEQVRDFH
jgi:hypothetical protein